MKKLVIDKEHPNGIMICDALNLTMATSVSKIFKKHNMKILKINFVVHYHKYIDLY